MNLDDASFHVDHFALVRIGLGFLEYFADDEDRTAGFPFGIIGTLGDVLVGDAFFQIAPYRTIANNGMITVIDVLNREICLTLSS